MPSPPRCQPWSAVWNRAPERRPGAEQVSTHRITAVNRSCPPSVARVVGAAPWEPYPGVDLSPVIAAFGQRAPVEDRPPEALDPAWPGSTWRVGDLWVRRSELHTGAIEAEVDRLRWLSSQPSTSVMTQDVLVVEDGWLVSGDLPGHPAHEPDRQPVPEEVPGAVGDLLATLHRRPVESCPFLRTTTMILAEIERAVAESRLDAQRLPHPYSRYEPSRLVELLEAGRPAQDDLVVCHGSPSLHNLFVDGGRPSGLTGVHRLGVADRHLDLAVAHRSMQAIFGGEAVFGFYEGYGIDPDLVRLDYFVLVDVVTGAIAPTPTSTSADPS